MQQEQDSNSDVTPLPSWVEHYAGWRSMHHPRTENEARVGNPPVMAGSRGVICTEEALIEGSAASWANSVWAEA